MATLKLEANYRSDMSKSRMKQARKQGFVTGSIFGHDTEPVSVELNLEDLVHLIKKSEGGVQSLIDLKINGAPSKSDGVVIIKEFHKDPLTRKVLDIQFQRIHMKEKIHVDVPVVIVGEAPGTKNGGIVEEVLDHVRVSCLPGDIPSKIEIDISAVGVGDHIRVSDLSFEGDVELISDPDGVVVTCRPPYVARATEEHPAETETAETETSG